MISILSSRFIPNLLFGTIILGSTSAASAALFDSGIPSDWTCNGSCGTSGANGVVSAAPNSNQYGWVSTSGSSNTTSSLPAIGIPGSATNRSVVQSSTFSANTGDTLAFYFNYVTTDGSSFSDYAWARLLDESLNQVALLFVARTHPENTDADLPNTDATLSRPVSIIPGEPQWSAFEYTGCYIEPGQGCGYTDWIESTYQIMNAGSYILEFGVTNWNDTAMDSGLAFSGAIIPGSASSSAPVSEPTLPALFGLGLAALGLLRRRT